MIYQGNFCITLMSPFVISLPVLQFHPLQLSEPENLSYYSQSTVLKYLYIIYKNIILLYNICQEKNKKVM